MLASIVYLLIYIVVIAIVFWGVVYVLRKVGVEVPQIIVQLLGLLALLLVIAWFLTNGHMPAL